MKGPKPTHFWIDEDVSVPSIEDVIMRPPRRADVQFITVATMLGLFRQIKPPVPCPIGMRSGRTTWMIDRLVDSINIGQPRMIVVGKNRAHCQELHRMIFDRLRQEGFAVLARSSMLLISTEGECDKQEIRFFTADEMESGECLRGLRGWAEFWDHFADGEV